MWCSSELMISIARGDATVRCKTRGVLRSVCLIGNDMRYTFHEILTSVFPYSIKRSPFWEANSVFGYSRNPARDRIRRFISRNTKYNFPNSASPTVCIGMQQFSMTQHEESSASQKFAKMCSIFPVTYLIAYSNRSQNTLKYFHDKIFAEVGKMWGLMRFIYTKQQPLRYTS
jgi:hypothetical protein